MLDVNAVLGFLPFFRSEADFNQAKTAVAKVLGRLESDDLAYILDRCCRGPGEIVGGLANCKRLIDENEFVKISKDAFAAVCKLPSIHPKHIFLFGDTLTTEIDRTLQKFDRMGRKYEFPAVVHGIFAGGQEIAENVSKYLKESNVIR